MSPDVPRWGLWVMFLASLAGVWFLGRQLLGV